MVIVGGLSGTQMFSDILYNIMTSFWVLHALESWLKYTTQGGLVQVL